MNGKKRNSIQKHNYSNQYQEKLLSTKIFNPNSASISCSVNLRRGSVSLEEGNEFDCFKDDNLRVYGGGGLRHVERAGLNLFRKQKRIKWMETLNEEQDIEHEIKQSYAGREQKIHLPPKTVQNFTKNSTILNHRSTSQGLSRQIYTSLQRKRQGITRQTFSTGRFHGKKHQTSLDKYEHQKNEIQAKEIKFQILAKPMIQRLPTKLKRKTKQDLKRMYSPSKIFHKASRNKIPIQTSEQPNFFKAWQLSEDVVNEFQDYTEELFSCQTLDLKPPVKSPQRNILSRRK